MKKIFKNLDMPLLVITIILFIIGLIMVFSASNVTAYMSTDASPYKYFIRQGIFLGIGVVLALIISIFSTKGLGRISYPLIIIVLATEMLLPWFGYLVNDSRSWYKFNMISYQPSEFLKVTSIVFLAYYYGKNKDKLNKLIKVLIPLVICGIGAIFIFKEPDLGTMLIYGSIVGLIYILQPIPLKTTLWVFLIMLAAGGAFVGFEVATGHKILIDRQSQRLDLKDPCSRLLSSGNQVCNGYIAINNGGLTGVGLGNSTQKYLYLPEPYTDFIFCIILEELGLVVGIGIIILYMILLWRIMVIGRRSPTNMGTTMCYAIAFYIFIHIAINLLGIMGLIPITGVPLPFMSYGGSFTICLIAALTIVQRVNIDSRLTSN